MEGHARICGRTVRRQRSITAASFLTIIDRQIRIRFRSPDGRYEPAWARRNTLHMLPVVWLRRSPAQRERGENVVTRSGDIRNPFVLVLCTPKMSAASMHGLADHMTMERGWAADDRANHNTYWTIRDLADSFAGIGTLIGRLRRRFTRRRVARVRDTSRSRSTTACTFDTNRACRRRNGQRTDGQEPGTAVE